MKIPKIEDLYFDDAYMANPGVVKGILESDDPTRITTSRIDDNTESVFYQTDSGFHYYVGQRPVMLAAANIPSNQQVMSDTGGGAAIGFRPALPKRPTGQALEVPMSPAARVISKGATWLGDLIDKGASTLDVMQLIIPGGFDENKKISIPTSFKPQAGRINPATGEMMPATMGLDEVDTTLGELLKAIPVSELLGLRGVSKVAESLGTGNMPELFDVLDTIGVAGAGLGAASAAKSVTKAVGQTVKSLAPKAAEMTLDLVEKTGMPVRGLGIIEPGASAAGKATAPVSDTGFYSAVEQAALNIQRKSGTGQAFLNDITKGENVKADEIKWIGLDDFLKDKKNVTKADVQNFIAQNKVDVQEVTLGGEFKAITDPQEAINYLAKEKGLTPDQLVDEYGYIDLNDYVNLANDVAQPAEPKFGAYTLPGGQNYREILLTMPFKEPAMPKGYEVTSVQYDDGTYRYFANTPTTRSAAYKTEADAMAELQSMASRLKGFRENQEAFKSSHWDQNNVLAHIRVNDRVDADGKKMLLVEEVQSDWHQAGRDKGYRVTPSEDEIQRIMDSSSYMSRADAIDYLTNKNAVPDAPMKDTWYQLALKRVLKYAADNGYERVGLTTGSRQAERYDLSAQVDEIKVPMVADDGSRSVAIKPVDGGTIKLMVDSDGTVTGYGPSARQFTGKKIDEVIGKELADKVMKAEEDTSLTGLDLKVGGQGMKKYYDEVYPQFLAKYGKKWGAKVGETRIETEQSPKSWAYFREWFAANHSDVGGSSTALAQWESGEKSKYVREFLKQNKAQEPVRYIDITPQMKESVGKGQPLFSATGIATGAGAGTMATSQQEPK